MPPTPNGPKRNFGFLNVLLTTMVGAGLIGTGECALAPTNAHRFHDRVHANALSLSAVEWCAALGMVLATHLILWFRSACFGGSSLG